MVRVRRSGAFFMLRGRGFCHGYIRSGAFVILKVRAFVHGPIYPGLPASRLALLSPSIHWVRVTRANPWVAPFSGVAMLQCSDVSLAVSGLCCT